MREQTAEAAAELASDIVRAPANAGVGAMPRVGPIGVEQTLRLQRTAGNRATRALLRRTLARDEITVGEVTVQGTAWKEDSVKAVQTELTRLRLYDKGIDGKPGFFTHQGLIEAFGGYDWVDLSDEDLLKRLQAAKTPPAKSGHRLRYGVMFADGVLDITLGIGYWEGATGAMEKVRDDVADALKGIGFSDDFVVAQRVLQKAMRTVATGAIGRFLAKESAFTYTPPAGKSRAIDVVVRIVLNPAGNKGGEALDAFLAAMTQGDVAYYMGHGRYGSGPDFDPNFGSFTLIDPNGDKQTLTDYDVLEKALAKDGDAWTVFLKRVKDRTLIVELSNAGNLWLNSMNKHTSEFGAKLIYWALQQTGKLATGASGSLASGAARYAHGYRVLVFSGCRTQDYDQVLRATPGFGTREADILETTREIAGQPASGFTAFVNDLMAQASGEKVASDLNAEMKAHEPGFSSNPFKFSGLEDNPSM
jgi:hypothetical protein